MKTSSTYTRLIGLDLDLDRLGDGERARDGDRSTSS